VCQRRGRIETMDEKGAQKLIRGMVPLGEISATPPRCAA
jgi:translation elongation factor EF-G